jgi:hypothetical protein
LFKLTRSAFMLTDGLKYNCFKSVYGQLMLEVKQIGHTRRRNLLSNKVSPLLGCGTSVTRCLAFKRKKGDALYSDNAHGRICMSIARIYFKDCHEACIPNDKLPT